ncbi:hypothetical protein E4T39_04533 [Aureobasidium subglaciale]|nr:hypothetical protein E4T39_04533 [Aureobasidium subglaciale]
MIWDLTSRHRILEVCLLLFLADLTNQWGTACQHFVQPTCQGKGYGRALFEAVMQEFKSNNTSIIGLDAVVEQKTTYERRGFVESPLGKLRCMSWNISTNIDHGTSHDPDTNLRLIDIKDVPYHLLTESDLDHTGFERKRLWGEKFFSRSDVSGLALIGGEGARNIADIRAWTVVRQVPPGYRLGPVYATDQEFARRIVLASMEHAMGRMENTSTNSAISCPRVENSIAHTITAEIWDGNPHAVELFEKLGWSSVGVDYHRMWFNGKATPQQDEGGLAHSGMYAIFDAAIG